ncbi:hypothetical protein Taro_027692 [Colocasia esculenta]|uniref:Uncharacterized protein n=1 Tax=Colocasia esculenta TaxID=4460 RepID=A0A843VKV6_COLES|nr:hypothetical protein [Colocasia esculenta]
MPSSSSSHARPSGDGDDQNDAIASGFLALHFSHSRNPCHDHRHPLATSLLNAVPLCIAVDAAVPLSCHLLGGCLVSVVVFAAPSLAFPSPLSIAFPRFVVLLPIIPIDLRRDEIRFGAPWSYLLIGVVLLILLLLLLLLLLACGGRGFARALGACDRERAAFG